MPKPAAIFDFVGAATAGYKFTWSHRKIIAQYALPLFLVKFATYVIFTSFSIDIPVLRQGLVQLPSFVIEGWLLAVLVRLYMTPHYLSGEGTRTILAATLLYVLIQLFLSMTTGLTVMNKPPIAEAGVDVPPPSFAMFVAAFIALSAIVWSFRLLWYYIPVAIGYPLRPFTDKISGFMTSIYMLGTWFMCLLPTGMVYILFSEIILYGVPDDAQPGAVHHFILIATRTVVEILVAVISTIAITEGIRQMLFAPPSTKK